MNLFGKKPKDGGMATSKKKKKGKVKKNKRVYKNPSDAKLFYRMPILLLVGIFCMLGGGLIVWHNNSEYTQKIMSSSMPKGTALPIRMGTGGTGGTGKLTLGNSLLSADGETLAVEIQYNEEAHNSLSSFGDNYSLNLIVTRENPMKNAKVNYGMFGTDGSGVLTIHQKGGFADKAFMIYLIDKGIIVSSDSLGTRRTMTDEEIEKSLAKQLEEIDTQTDTDNEKTTDKVLPPTYVIRLNAFNAEKSYRNWDTDSEVVEDLFVDGNLKKIKEKQKEMGKQLESGETSLEEMNKRLEKNEHDSTAQRNKQELERNIKTLKEELEKAQKNYDKISKSHIQSDVLEPKQESFETYTVIDINKVK